MGITRERFLEKVEEIAQSNPSYKEGRDGSDGTCDCIGLIIGAIRRAGGSWTGIHGSNYAARYEMRELLPVMDAGELNLGEVVYKARMPGEVGYALPERYKNDPDQRDYYHVGGSHGRRVPWRSPTAPGRALCGTRSWEGGRTGGGWKKWHTTARRWWKPWCRRPR